MLCIRALMTVLLNQAHACLTVIKPFGLHLALTQSQNPLSLSFSICVCVLYGCFPLVLLMSFLSSDSCTWCSKDSKEQTQCSYLCINTSTTRIDHPNSMINLKGQSFQKWKFSRSCRSTPVRLSGAQNKIFSFTFPHIQILHVTFSYETCEKSNMAC